MLLRQLPQAIVFDLDGTLSHTLPQLTLAAIEVAKEMNLPVPSKEEMTTFVGNGVKMLLARIIASKHDVTLEEIDPQVLSKARELFAKHYLQTMRHDIVLYDGVKEGLELFKKLHIKMAIVTNKPNTFTQPLVEYMGIKPYFDYVLGGEVLEHNKPHPQPILAALEHMQVDSSASLMVGDSVNDVQGGHNAHMCTVAFTYGYNGGYDVRSAHPDYLFNSFRELNDLIASLASSSQA